MKELIEKLKELGMKEEDILALSEAVNKSVDEKVSLKLDEATKTLVESNKKVIEEAVNAEKVKLEEGYTQKLAEVNADMLEKLDLFLEAEVQEKIGPELLEQAGKYEAVAPILEGISKLYESHYVKLDTEGASVIKRKDEELVAKTKELSESIGTRMDLVKELDNAKKKLLITEKTANLSENQTKRVIALMEDKDFAYANSKIDAFISICEDKKEVKTESNLNENTDAISKEDKILTEKKEVKTENVITPDAAQKKILSIAGDLV